MASRSISLRVTSSGRSALGFGEQRFRLALPAEPLPRSFLLELPGYQPAAVSLSWSNFSPGRIVSGERRALSSHPTLASRRRPLVLGLAQSILFGSLCTTGVACGIFANSRRSRHAHEGLTGAATARTAGTCDLSAGG